MSAIIPYILTFIGVVVDNISHFPELAITFTVIGVLWTSIRSLAKKSGLKGFLLGIGGHGLIWLLFRGFPNVGASIVSTLIGILIAIVILALAWVYFIGPMFFNTNSNVASSSSENTRQSLPSIMYDMDNQEWHLAYDYKNGEYDYCSKDKKQTIRIYSADISGNTANTSAGRFHWY